MQYVTLIGTGNVGTHLGRRLHACGVPVRQVYSRRLERAQELAGEIGAQAIDQWSDLQSDAGLYILAISDDAIPAAAGQMQRYLPERAFVVHTSGATPSDTLHVFPRRGVFYPLQTFSKERAVDFSNVPVCVFAIRPDDENLLEELGRTVSEKVYRINDHERAVLHVAAVFANNFANHCFQMSYDILTKEKLPFELLEPLILETARKIPGRTPADMQTGPAVRGDAETIRRHLDYLERTNSPYRELYQLLSKSIGN